MLPTVSVRAAAALFGTLVTLAQGTGAIEIRQVTRNQVVGYYHVSGYDTPVWLMDGQSLMVAMLTFFMPSCCPPAYEIVYVVASCDLNGNLAGPWWDSWWAHRPSLDPTHTRFAVGCHVNLSCVGVCVVSPDAHPDPLLACLPGRNPAWSPDGLTIVVETASGLQMFSSSGSAGVPLTMRGDDEAPAWSPDGQDIVFSSTQGGTRDLWIQNVASGAVRPLTADAAADEWPAWSPDGRWIAFASDRDGGRRILAISSTGGNPLRVADLPGSSAPAWSPDGQSLAFQSDGQIWVATGLRDVLVSVESKTWSDIKTLYRDPSR